MLRSHHNNANWQDEDSVLQKKSYKALLNICNSDVKLHTKFIVHNYKDIQARYVRGAECF